LDGVPSAVKAALTKAYKQREGERRVRSADLLPVLSLPGLKKAPKKPAHLRLMNFEDAENGDSPKEELDSGMSFFFKLTCVDRLRWGGVISMHEYVTFNSFL
jgi:replication factor C subunit 1